MNTSICFLVAAEPAADPRVRRHGDFLHARGWDVSAIGVYGLGIDAGDQADWTIRTTRYTPTRFVTRAWLALVYALAAFLPVLWKRCYWRLPHVRGMWQVARNQSAEIYVANDWLMLPLAHALARRHGGRVVYDSHEDALTENAHSWRAQLLITPMARRAEACFVARCHAVMTVSEAIAATLRKRYRLTEHPTVVRNAPAYRAFQPRPTGERITILYHGVFTRNRGLEEIIDSVVEWPPQYDLVLRGFGGLAKDLETRVTRLRLGTRIRIEDAIPAAELIDAATTADIGLVGMPPTSAHNRGGLPNKFFEYVQARLAIWGVADSPEMSAFLKRHNLGFETRCATPSLLAESLKRLSRADIDRWKRASHVAAEDMSFEQLTAEPLIRVLEGACS
ncbi:MAG: glycosyltransferase [Pseudomonadota bacterium]